MELRVIFACGSVMVWGIPGCCGGRRGRAEETHAAIRPCLLYQQSRSAGGLCLRMSFFRDDLFSVSCRRIDSEKYVEFLVFGISPPALITLPQTQKVKQSRAAYKRFSSPLLTKSSNWLDSEGI